MQSCDDGGSITVYCVVGRLRPRCICMEVLVVHDGVFRYPWPDTDDEDLRLLQLCIGALLRGKQQLQAFIAAWRSEIRIQN